MAITFNSVSTNIAISAANTATDGTGSISTLITGATPYGTILDTIQIQTRDTTVPRGMIRLFIKTGGGGTWRLFGNSGQIDPLSPVQIDPFKLTPNNCLFFTRSF